MFACDNIAIHIVRKVILIATIQAYGFIFYVCFLLPHSISLEVSFCFIGHRKCVCMSVSLFYIYYLNGISLLRVHIDGLNMRLKSITRASNRNLTFLKLIKNTTRTNIDEYNLQQNDPYTEIRKRIEWKSKKISDEIITKKNTNKFIHGNASSEKCAIVKKKNKVIMRQFM